MACCLVDRVTEGPGRASVLRNWSQGRIALGWPRAKGPRGILKEEKQGQMVEYFSPCPHGVWTFTEQSVMAATRSDVTCVMPGMASTVRALALSGHWKLPLLPFEACDG